MTVLIYVLIFCALFVYSYSQIDLNLTLASFFWYQNFQQQLIGLGYFNRPLSTVIFLVITFLLFGMYFLTLFLTLRNKFEVSKLLMVIIIGIIILAFSYPAFSHDFFNYLFDARIITKYGMNPYFYKASDFPQDLWIRFMHWTHRTYPYGPAWLILTIPFSFLGFSKFVLTLFLFKILFVLSYVGNSLLIYKILKKKSPKNALLGLSFYALNPLILIETLVSPHLDSVMLTFLLFGIYLLIVEKNKILASVSLIISGLVKFVTFPLLLVFLLSFFKKEVLAKKVNVFLIINFTVLLLAIVIPVTQREPYPWYFIPLIGMGALLTEYTWMRIMLSSLSLGLLLRYAPYLYIGDYSSLVTTWQAILFFIPLFIALVLFSVKKFLNRVFTSRMI